MVVRVLVGVLLFGLGMLFELGSLALAAPEIPGTPQSRPIAIIGATVHPASGPTVENATLLFSEGKIVAIGGKLTLPADVEKIEGAGKHIYPGLIEPHSQLGLLEIETVRATRDHWETGSINPNVRAQIAFNPDSELLPVARSNGVLMSLAAPIGGLMSGTSALMQLDGWTWEDMTLQANVGSHVIWPRSTPLRESFSRPVDTIDGNKREEAIAAIRQALTDARSYLLARKAPSTAGQELRFDARWEALIPVLEGKMPLIVQADEIQQIQAVVAWTAKEQVKLIIVGGYDAPHCAALLKQHDVPVIVHGVNRLPQRRDDPYHAAFTVPARLHAAGIRFCISDGKEPWNVRNLPYHAATAAVHGLPIDEALRSITLYPAQILGVADRVGSLETGKDATLFVANGDILEIPTQVEAAFIQGRRVDLSDRHKRLYEKYKEKYRRLGIQN